MTSELLPCVEIMPGGEPNASVIWLHGLGADGHDFEPIVGEFAQAIRSVTRFVFPHAPERPITINGGYVMRAWYDIAATDLGRTVDLAGVETSCSQVSALIERERARGVASERIILAGFSQGGVIALESAARYAEPLGGIVALSTYLADPMRFLATQRPMPVFLAHGTDDPIVPFSMGQQARGALERLGYTVTWRSYAMPHSVCAQEIVDIGAWLDQRLFPANRG